MAFFSSPQSVTRWLAVRCRVLAHDLDGLIHQAVGALAG